MKAPKPGHPAPVSCAGAVLAGGAGSRIGGEKALVEVAGRPLIAYVLDALSRVARPVAVVTRAETALPAVPDDPAELLLRPQPQHWVEPDGPRHPLNGVVHALSEAGGPVLVCAVDLPLIDAETLNVLLIAAALAPDAAAVVPRTGRQLQVLCALYRPSALDALIAAGPDARVQEVVQSLNPAIVPFDDETPFFNVNTPQDVPQAEKLLARRGRVSRR